jgi:hypothetical protein
MSELDNGAHRAASEVLNTPYETLVKLSDGILSDRESLSQYITDMQRQSPGLAKQIGAWVGILRGSIPYHGLEVALRAEGAFTAGSAMIYELLRRVSNNTNQPVPDAVFIHDNLTDSEQHNETPQWLIELSFRGEKLFRDHPAFFDTSLVMFTRSNGSEPDKVKEMLFSAPDTADVFSFDLVHYLKGAAEIVLPIERQAEVSALEQ